MKKLLLTLVTLLALTSSALATDINIGASSITGFNSANAGVDTALSNVSVTLGSPHVTCSNCLPVGAVGLSGMKVSLGTPAVTYDIASVASRSAFTLTANYAASTGTVSGTLHKFVHLRIYVIEPFVPAGSTTVVQSGAPGSTAWYRRYGVSIINNGSQNVAHIPAINDLPATTDSSDLTATYTAGLWTQGGGFMQSFPGCVDEFRLSHLTSPTSWAQICSFNSTPPTPPSPLANFYTAAQIDARFPSCSVNQLIYYAATGNVQSCLSFAPGDFSISGGVISTLNPLKQIQEEGSNLPIRNFLNFVGSSYAAVDDPGNGRTNVTADSDLDALASNATNGFWARTGAGTGAARTILGTVNRIVVTNGDGSVSNLTIDIGSLVATSNNNLSFFSPTTSAQLAGVISDETGSGALVFGTSPSLATPTVSGGTFTSPRIVTSILDTNGNELIAVSPTASAVNEISITNATTGNGPTIAVTGSDANPNLNINAKGTGRVVIRGYPFTLEVNTTIVGNVGTGVDNLHSFTLPAGSLANDGDFLHVRYKGDFASNANAKRVRVTVDGQIAVDTSLFVIGAAEWVYDIYYIRVTSTSIRVTAIALNGFISRDQAGTTLGNATHIAGGPLVTVANLNSNNIIVLVQAEATANNDVTQAASIIELVQR